MRIVSERPRIRENHGMFGKPEYNAWQAMLTRCYNPTAPYYKNYGGRGIKVCDEWRLSFIAFYQYMGPRPGKGYSLDRINNDGNYELGNCRWATIAQQASNTTRNKYLTYAGETHTITEWAHIKGIHTHTLQGRIKRGVPLESLFKPTPLRFY